MSQQLGRIKAIFMDMDDTLVMTGDADLKAYIDVVTLAKQLHAQVCIPCCTMVTVSLASKAVS